MTTGGPSAIEHDLAIHPDRLDSCRRHVRIFYCRPIADALRIEQHEIGGESGANDAPIADPDVRCGQTRHLAHRIFEREHFELAHVVTQDSSERSVSPWVRAFSRASTADVL